MRSFLGARWSIVALSLLVAAALGGAAVILLLPQSAPPELRSASPVSEVPVTSTSFDDRRTVEVTLTTGAERQVTSPGSGVVTASRCSPGGELTSGQTVVSIRGRPVIAVATAEPLWRTLHSGDFGSDVRALQKELARLGYTVRVDGIVGGQTLTAIDRLLDRGANEREVPVESFAWLPSATVTTPACRAVVGGTIEAGEALAILPVELSSARMSSSPSRLVEGPRTLEVGAALIPIRADGTVSDPAAIAALAGTTEYAAATTSDDLPSLTAAFALATPLRVTVVPPAAVFDLHGAEGCVASGGRVVPVEVVGSELGETFVVPPSKTRIETVTLNAEASGCR